ncbi:MAG: dCMP deaminase family protein [Alphaproteobacteria bacterium]|jgi:dCMP deaminase|nr:dCMP deaminase family protein [Alphaproteobacteria bacterium]
MTENFSEKWNYRFMELALHISTWSKDPSTKVGCIVVGPDKEIRSQGYNGFPRGVNDDVEYRQLRPTKYAFYEHAERNAIYNACSFGASLRGCTLYVTMPPCADCARAIIQSGIKQVYFLTPEIDAAKPQTANWRDTVVNSFEMFREAGVKTAELKRELVNTNIVAKFKPLMEKQK